MEPNIKIEWIDRPAGTSSAKPLEQAMHDAFNLPESEVFRKKLTDLGVEYVERDNSVAIPLILVQKDPACGQYSFDEYTGEYSFSKSDKGKSVTIRNFRGRLYPWDKNKPPVFINEHRILIA